MNLIFAAHPDDETLGCAGTIAKLIDEKEEVYSYILTFGELANPWMKKKELVKKRISESENSAKILGNQLKFLDYFEADFSKIDEQIKKSVKSKIKRIIKRQNPKRIFTHQTNDPHPLHKFLVNIVIEIAQEIEFKGSIYGFQIWNILPINIKDQAKIYFDITKYLGKKINALKEFKSQKVSIYQLAPVVIIKSKFAGWASNCHFAEEFSVLY